MYNAFIINVNWLSLPNTFRSVVIDLVILSILLSPKCSFHIYWFSHWWAKTWTTTTATVMAKPNNDSSPQQQQHPRNDSNPATMDPAYCRWYGQWECHDCMEIVQAITQWRRNVKFWHSLTYLIENSLTVLLHTWLSLLAATSATTSWLLVSYHYHLLLLSLLAAMLILQEMLLSLPPVDCCFQSGSGIVVRGRRCLAIIKHQPFWKDNCWCGWNQIDAFVDLIFGIQLPLGQLAETFMNMPFSRDQTVMEYWEGLNVGYCYFDTAKMVLGCY